MENINKTNVLLANLTTILSKEATELIYSSKNIKYERCNLYSDFIQSLITTITDTYMGDDVTSQDDEKIRHFKWCFDKTIDNFKKENIHFKDTIDLYDYFLIFLFKVYYQVSDKKTNPNLANNIGKMWLKLFDMFTYKTKSDMDSFLELYELFEKSLLKK